MAGNRKGRGGAQNGSHREIGKGRDWRMTMILILPSIPLLRLSDQDLRVWAFPSSSATCGGHARKAQTSEDGCKLYLFSLSCVPY